MGNTLVSLREVSRDYSVRPGFFSSQKKTIRALDRISIDLRQNEILGLVGESGCGKSTLARITLGLEQPTSGAVFFRGKDISSLDSTEKKSFRQKAQMIFQDPYSSLNPRKTILQILKEPLEIHGLCPRNKYVDRVRELLGDAGLNDEDILERYPHEFSGGQRQRIGLARALATSPELIIADEPTSALDVSIQAQIINLLLDLQEQRGLSYLFISHDLPIIQFVSHRIAVMYRGQLMELMPGGSFLVQGKGSGEGAMHPYTRYLLSAVPVPDPDRKIIKSSGNAQAGNTEPEYDSVHVSDRNAHDANINGCSFAPRCSQAAAACFDKRPEWKQIEKNHFVACHMVATS